MSQTIKMVMAVTFLLLIFSIMLIAPHTQAEKPKKWISCTFTIQSDECASGWQTCQFKCYVSYPYNCPHSPADCIPYRCWCEPEPIR